MARYTISPTEKLAEATTELATFRSVVIVRLRNMTAIDAAGVHALEVFAKRLRESGRTLLVCGTRNQPEELLKQAEFVERVGPENVLPNVEAALRRAPRLQSCQTAKVCRSGASS